ncbi:hypothetical protein [Carboxylicivirga caseinilyticus]|uniref:hypothetical protein n=1 Tax=Carboxylicivirga caseinilyticus TaxID=3417572 RepID=UPI003D33E1E0|nr:hypothetical protein [Marinilabiliaceae bacterium A049]
MKPVKTNALISKIKDLSIKIFHPRVHYVFITDENGLSDHFNELKKKLRLKVPMVSLVYLHENKPEESIFISELKSFRKRFRQQFILHFIKYERAIPEDASHSIQRVLELEINCSLRKRIQFRFYGSTELAEIVKDKIELLNNHDAIFNTKIIQTTPF